MRIIVTGGAGFIGSNLCNSLARAGHDVHAIDDLFLGRKSNLDKDVHFRERDVTQYIHIRHDVTDIQPEVIFHLAASSSSPMFKDNEQLALNNNIMGFTNVMAAAHRLPNTPKLIYASSSSIYNGIVPPWSEFDLVEPTTFYEVSFRAREQIAHAYYEEYGIPSAGMRFFSVYGPHEHHKGKYANIITQFLWAMLKGERPMIYGDGSQSRDFIHVDDVVSCLQLAMRKDLDQDCLFNVGTGVANSFNQVVDLLNTALGTNIEPNKIQNQIKNYVAGTLADTDWTARTLGFKSSISLEEGIKSLIPHYKDDLRVRF